MAVFHGSCVALCTPFTQNGVNTDTLRRLIDFHIKEGTDAILVCGTTGEPSTMTADEERLVIQTAVTHCGGEIPIIAGTGGNNTARVLAASKEAESLGADALLLVTPYYNKCTQNGLVKYYHTVADAVGIPVIAYNVPGRTGVNIAPETWAQIAAHKNIDGIKEASGNIAQIVESARLTRGTAALYSGNDDHTVPILSVGGAGGISVTANLAPAISHELVTSFLQGDMERARELQFKLNPLTAALFAEVSPIPVKTGLRLMGFDMGPLRAPLTEMEDTGRLKKEMAALQLI